jgi:tetratricopeptide (TPR) repeat protein
LLAEALEFVTEDSLAHAAVLNNLAEVERILWNRSEAESYDREALAITERSFGPSHPEVATVRLNLGVLCAEDGRAAESIRHIRQALEIWSVTLREFHPFIATGHWNLGRALTDEHQFAEADDCFRQALMIAEGSLGPEHPQVGEILWDYAKLLRKMKQKREAKELRKRAMAILSRNERENLLHHTVDWSALAKRER